MMASCLPYRYHLITLRLWQEEIDGDLWEWRGEVKNISTGEFRYFRDFSVLANLLSMLLTESTGYQALEQQDSNATFPSQRRES
jgi:hypothetical protein